MLNSKISSANLSKHIGNRTEEALKVARLSARNLGGAIGIHFVTIYRVMRSEDGSLNPPYEHTLNTALNKIARLVEAGELPFKDRLSGNDKTSRLAVLLNDN